MDAVQAMIAELEMMRGEKIYMEARLIAAETALEEKKRVLSEYKAMAKLADDLLDVVMEAGDDDYVHENSYRGQDLDEETMKELIEEAVREFTEAPNQTQSLGTRPADGGNDGGYDDSTVGDDHSKEAGGNDGGYDDGTVGDDHSKEAGGNGGGKQGGNGCGHPY